VKSYLISYDNRAPRNYARVYQLMAALHAVRLTDSLWMANLPGPANVIRDLVRGTMDANDAVTVVEIKRGSDWATVNVEPAASGWLSANITPSQIAA
jgi:hypothetical protein